MITEVYKFPKFLSPVCATFQFRGSSLVQITGNVYGIVTAMFHANKFSARDKLYLNVIPLDFKYVWEEHSEFTLAETSARRNIK